MLEAAGRVASNTQSVSGPASFQNRGTATYTAKKMLRINHQGMKVDKATAQANGRTNLVGLETDYDGLPLIGYWARSVAEQEYGDRSRTCQRADGTENRATGSSPVG